MAKVRIVNTRFWSDNFIRESLNPLDRYLFLYFLTNEKTNIAGVYELPISTISSETGIEKDMLLKMFKRLSGRIDYHDGWVIIRNFNKYQNNQSKDIQKGIERALNEIPQKIKDFMVIPMTIPGGSIDSPRQPEVLIPIPEPILIPELEPTEGAKRAYGELNNVQLSEKEHQKLVERFGEQNVNALIFELDTYIGSKGKRYKSHYATILSWAKRKIDNYKRGTSATQPKWKVWN